jgi:hypothetical protein
MASGFFQKALFALVFVGLGSVGTLAGSALATPGGGGGGGAGGGGAGDRGGGRTAMVEKLVQDLNLSGEQMAKGQEVKERVTARMKDMRQQRKAGFEELANELSNGPIDRKAVHKLADRRLDTVANNIHASTTTSRRGYADPQQRRRSSTTSNQERTGSRRGARTAPE